MNNRYVKLGIAVLALLFLLLCGCASAEGEVTTVASGSCGEHVTWELDSAGTLTFSGTGAMQDYSMGSYPHWSSTIKAVVIADGVTRIGDFTFYGLSSLTSITIPDSVTSIGEKAFYPDEGMKLKDVYAESLEGWLGIAFADSTSNPMSYDRDLYFDNVLAENITIPDGVTRIGDYAFERCSCLTSITIPDSVTSIGNSAFSDCNGLKNVYAENLEAWLGIAFENFSSNPMYEAENLYFDNILAENITIPDGVTRLGDYVFSGCRSLTGITIPNSVTSIGDYVFSGCRSLTGITIPNSVTSIGDSAFSDCRSLTSIAIPGGVTSIGDYTFYGCSGLTGIAIPDGVTSIGDYAFSDCSSLKSITIPGSVTRFSNGAFYSCSGLTNITIPDNVTSIGNYALCCANLDKVIFEGMDMPAMGTYVFRSAPTIYCYEFSDVDFWAEDQGYKCVYLDNLDMTIPLELNLPDSHRLRLNDRLDLSGCVFPATAVPNVKWTSSAPEIVSVKDGVLTAVGAGDAVITASYGELSDSMVVSSSYALTDFNISVPELWIVSKETAQLDIVDKVHANANATFTWASSDTSVLTVDETGLITAKVPGDATVTVTADNGLVRECAVHVCYPVTAIEFENAQVPMHVGESTPLTANVTARTQSFVNKLVSFTSSDEAIAAVDEDGVVSALRTGIATITARAANGVSASCEITVHPVVIDPAVPATHVTTGLTEGRHCPTCNAVLVSQEEIPLVDVPIVSLSASLKVIEAQAFAGDTFQCVVIPEGCKRIGAGAFEGNMALRFVEIPASVEFIDASAFKGCSGDLIFVTTSGSAAEAYAAQNSLVCILK